MLICITGTREMDETEANYDYVYTCLRRVDGIYHDEPIAFMHGGARGVDTIGAQVAEDIGWEVLPAFEAQWTRYGKAAGPIRNRQMLAEEPDLVVAFWTGKTKNSGTFDMMTATVKQKILLMVFPASE